MRINTIEPVFVETIPGDIESGKLYVSKQFNIAIHLCACGCGQKTVTPLKPSEWVLLENEKGVSLEPSIGNFKGEDPYHAHYFIRENKIIWS